MFTRDDYKQYFEEIALTERAMVYQVEDIISVIDEGQTKNILNVIVSDEIRHYASMMNVLESTLLKTKTQQRAFSREHALGKVKMKCISTGKESDGYCVNVSAGGICIEFAEPLSVQDQYELRVDFYDSTAPMHRKGAIKWSAKINPTFYMAGISYRAGLEFGS